MNYQIIQPPPVLKEHVRYFWTLGDDRHTAETVYQTLVDDSSGIIFQHNEGESAFAHEGGKKLMTGFVYGQSTRPTTTFSKSKFQLTGVHFHPHALKTLFGIDAHLLTDQMEDISLLGMKELGRQIFESPCDNERVNLLSQFLQRRICAPLRTDMLVCYCIDRIKLERGRMSLSRLLKEACISERQLERRFKNTVGISPKLYLRIIRFREALRMIKSNQYPRLSDIAFELNYADQSHFIRDIREFSGYTPGNLSADVSELILNLHLGATTTT